jgi:hypothetical protein
MGYDVEVILVRQAASYLAMPIFVVAHPKGDLVYFNEPAEELLGLRYEEVGEMPAEEWSTIFVPTDEHGDPIPPESLPLMIARRNSGRLMTGFTHGASTGPSGSFFVTAFPLIGQHARDLGAVAIFWEARPGWR